MLYRALFFSLLLIATQAFSAELRQTGGPSQQYQALNGAVANDIARSARSAEFPEEGDTISVSQFFGQEVQEPCTLEEGCTSTFVGFFAFASEIAPTGDEQDGDPVEVCVYYRSAPVAERADRGNAEVGSGENVSVNAPFPPEPENTEVVVTGEAFAFIGDEVAEDIVVAETFGLGQTLVSSQNPDGTIERVITIPTTIGRVVGVESASGGYSIAESGGTLPRAVIDHVALISLDSSVCLAQVQGSSAPTGVPVNNAWALLALALILSGLGWAARRSAI
ncbi:MAG: hypothetical protein AAGI11_16555 [Pseudomonadota bacterium]